MKRTAFRLAVLMLVSVWPALAQEGHPLTGTWSGDWGPTATSRTHVTMVMSWDGKTVTGIINPGPDAIAVPSIVLDAANWTLRFEATGKDGAGVSVRILVEGTLEDVASSHRKITGTWRQGTATGDFTLTRD